MKYRTTFVLTVLFVCSCLSPVQGQEGLCVRRPSVDCGHLDRRGFGFDSPDDLALHQSLLDKCRNMLTCRVLCHPSADPCPLQDSFCTDELEDNVQCEDLPGEEDCHDKADCLWVSADTTDNIEQVFLQGPYSPSCNTRSVINVPGGLAAGSLRVDDICWNHTQFQGDDVDDTCGVPLDGVGRWYTLHSSIAAPLRIKMELSDNETLTTTDGVVLSVFIANEAKPGRLACQGYTPDDDDIVVVEYKSVTSNLPLSLDLVFRAYAGQDFYVLLSIPGESLKQENKVGKVKLTVSPATAESACDFQCGIFSRQNATCTCEFQADGSIFSVIDWHCEICRLVEDETICILESERGVYETDGTRHITQYCYHLTEGLDGETVCVEYDDDESPISYALNGQTCATYADPSCIRSGTFNCSEWVEDAVFDWCDSDGYEGAFAVDKWLFMDYLYFSPGRCHPISSMPSVEPTSTPTVAPSTAETSSSSSSLKCLRIAAVVAAIAAVVQT